MLIVYFGIGTISIPCLMYGAFKLDGKVEYDFSEVIKMPILIVGWPLFCIAFIVVFADKHKDKVVLNLRPIFDRKKLEEEEIDEYKERIGS